MKCHYWDKFLAFLITFLYFSEPILSAGDWNIDILEDNWTAVTKDHSRTAQFEHTVLITDDGVEVLTKEHR